MDDKKLQERVEEILEQGDRLVAQGERQIQAMDQLYSRIGLTPEELSKVIETKLLTQEQRNQAKKEIQAFKQELEQINHQAQTQIHGSSSVASKAAARGRLMI